MEWYALGFLDVVTNQGSYLVSYYNLVLGVGLGIMVTVSSFLLVVLFPFSMLGGKHYRFGHRCDWLEFLWGVMPAIILICLGYISIGNLYSGQTGKYIKNRLSIVAHQWYWSYEYSLSKMLLSVISYRGQVLCLGESANFTPSNEDSSFRLWSGHEFFSSLGDEEYNFMSSKSKTSLQIRPKALHMFYDSFSMVQNEEEYGFGSLLVEPDTMVLMPTKMKNVATIVSADVIHSWGVPSLGVKMDAVPSRMNSFKVFAETEGMFLGFCYEICGPEHSMMKILCGTLEAEDYYDWLTSSLVENSRISGFKVCSHKAFNPSTMKVMVEEC